MYYNGNKRNLYPFYVGGCQTFDVFERNCDNVKKNLYLSIFEKEKSTRFKNGLYDYVAVMLAYNTNKIEGSTLTLSDTQSLYTHDFVNTGGHKMDDLIESRNHFELFDFMLNTMNEPFTERLIKEYHQLLKKGTSDERWYGVGKYKKVPNVVGDLEVAQPHEVPQLMESLIDQFNDKQEVTLIDVLEFHHAFESIHPFQDGNGRVGRLIMFRQCLTHHITPFIVSAERREQYIKGLKEFKNDPTILENEAVQGQKAFAKIAEPFVKYYQKD